VSSSTKSERAHTVLSQLGLQDVAHTRIGSTEHRGISGGEQRRVSIGIELVAQPDVLVLDEPTSGLDSVTASRLIRLLKDLAAETGTTIIASIHQPSSALYRAFDQVVLLSKGRQLYFGQGRDGPVGWFERQGRICPKGYNVADWLLEIASDGTEGLLHGKEAMADDVESVESNGDSSRTSSGTGIGLMAAPSITSHRDTSTLPTGSQKRLIHPPLESSMGLGEEEYEKAAMGTYPPSQALYKGSSGMTGEKEKQVDLADLGGGQERVGRKWWQGEECATSFLTQVEVLSGREWRNLKRWVWGSMRVVWDVGHAADGRRDKTLLVAHVLLACVLGVFAGGLYYKVGVTIAGFQNRVGSLFFLGSLIAFSSLR
jgi:energy-coupling factor transporter ATP-binding protein EcfA2